MKHLNEAYNQLKDQVNQEFEKIGEFILCNEEELLHTDKKYDLPRMYNLDRHNNYKEYAIHTVTKDSFLAISIEDDEEVDFSMCELELGTLISILGEIETIKDNE